MACRRTLRGYYSRKTNPETGKRPLVFNSRDGFYDHTQDIGCGRCILCLVEKSRQWAVRCVHEASLYEKNCFLTLTFNQSCQIATRSARGRYQKLKKSKLVDPTWSLHKFHFQDFMKRLRKHFYGNSKGSVRYLHCGEYGETFARPHHHACLFNFDFPDKKLWSVREGVSLYDSETLDRLWGHGNCKIGEVSFDSAAYIARYTVKKLKDLKGQELYSALCDRSKNRKYLPDGRLREYLRMSRRPGLGKGWIDQYKSDVFPKDYIVIRGKKCKVPKFYNKNFELTNPEEYGLVKRERVSNGRNNPNNNPERMEASAIIMQANLDLLSRKVE